MSILENSKIFSDLLIKAWPDLSTTTHEKVVQFYRCVLKENESQNLTRLVSPADFIDGHVLDVRELLASGFVTFPAMDLGSGCGVPGLLAAICQGDSWILCDSEGHKAAFLARAAQECGVQSSVKVVSGRAEVFLAKEGRVESVVARAVGPVERIYNWLRPCSTWNTLVLLKGPGWGEEWEKFSTSHHRKELRIAAAHEYTVGAEAKKRIIVRLERVPRGTRD